MKSRFSAYVFGVEICDKEVIMCRQVFHEHSTIMRVKTASSFGLISGFNPQLLCSSCASLSSTHFYSFFSSNNPFSFQIVLITGGSKSWLQIALIRSFILRLVMLLTCVCRPHSERACSARQPDIIPKIHFARPIM